MTGGCDLVVFDLSRIWRRKAGFAEVASLCVVRLPLPCGQLTHGWGGSESFPGLKTKAPFILWYLVGSSIFITMEKERTGPDAEGKGRKASSTGRAPRVSFSPSFLLSEKAATYVFQATPHSVFQKAFSELFSLSP